MIGNDDVGLEGAAVVSLEVNSEISWDANTILILRPMNIQFASCFKNPFLFCLKNKMR